MAAMAFFVVLRPIMRRALELALDWAFRYDTALHRPYQDNLSALIHEPTFKNAAVLCASS